MKMPEYLPLDESLVHSIKGFPAKEAILADHLPRARCCFRNFHRDLCYHPDDDTEVILVQWRKMLKLREVVKLTPVFTHGKDSRARI